MIYTLQITAETGREHSPALHVPVEVTTITTTAQDVSDAEVEMVTEAFKAQIRYVLESRLLRTKPGVEND